MAKDRRKNDPQNFFQIFWVSKSESNFFTFLVWKGSQEIFSFGFLLFYFKIHHFNVNHLKMNYGHVIERTFEDISNHFLKKCYENQMTFLVMGTLRKIMTFCWLFIFSISKNFAIFFFTSFFILENFFNEIFYSLSK